MCALLASSAVSPSSAWLAPDTPLCMQLAGMKRSCKCKEVFDKIGCSKDLWTHPHLLQVDQHTAAVQSLPDTGEAGTPAPESLICNTDVGVSLQVHARAMRSCMIRPHTACQASLQVQGNGMCKCGIAHANFKHRHDLACSQGFSEETFAGPWNRPSGLGKPGASRAVQEHQPFTALCPAHPGIVPPDTCCLFTVEHPH